MFTPTQNGTEKLFREEDNYRFFLKRYTHFIHPIADTYAYCLMPNHIHFLVKIKSEENIEMVCGKAENFQMLLNKISKQFSNLFSSYTQSYNKVYNRRGSLFIPNFKRSEITSDEYFTKIIHYIHANPVHHGFINNISDWQWSSYNAFLSKNPTLLKRDEVLNWFGGVNEYLHFHREQIIVLKAEMEFNF